MPQSKSQPDLHDGAWHLDRRVPIALVATIMAQTFGIGWWISQLNSRVTALEQADIRQSVFIDGRVKLNEDRWELMQRDRNSASERLGKVEVGVQFLIEGVKRIENKLDRRPSAASPDDR